MRDYITYFREIESEIAAKVVRSDHPRLSADKHESRCQVSNFVRTTSKTTRLKFRTSCLSDESLLYGIGSNNDQCTIYIGATSLN